MCGIFGYVGTRDDAAQVVLAGLKKLEYRGYDSWGIAARQNGGALARLLVEKHTGKIGQATTSLPGGRAALGHTRWATHGGVTDANAHPHLDCQGRLAIIHNGIIENHADLRRELQATGRHTFTSQTDTEVVCHLLEDELRQDELAADTDTESRGAGGGIPFGETDSTQAASSFRDSGSPLGYDSGPRLGASEPRGRNVAGCERLIQALMNVFRRLDGLSAIGVLDPQLQCIAAAKNG